jgi:hypothetical protein
MREWRSQEDKKTREEKETEREKERVMRLLTRMMAVMTKRGRGKNG